MTDASSPTRRYRSPKRRAKAEETKRQILSAAERLFGEFGFAATTMDEIATEAGVSVATVYLHFSGRAAIVEAIADAVVSAPELSVEQVLHVNDPIEQSRLGARIMRLLNERSWVIADILRSSHGHDESLEALWVKWQERHLYAMQRAADNLAERDALREDVTVAEAADELYALMGTEVYRALVRERGWSPQRYEEWLFNTIRATLFR